MWVENYFFHRPSAVISWCLCAHQACLPLFTGAPSPCATFCPGSREANTGVEFSSSVMSEFEYMWRDKAEEWVANRTFALSFAVSSRSF